MNKVGKKYLGSLTSLRFFAAFAVVLFHSWNTYFADAFSGTPAWALNFIFSGFTAVSFFYFLSGFILAFNYGEAHSFNIDLTRFWRARVARVYPVFLLSLIIGAPFAFNNISHGETLFERGRDFLLSGGMNLTLLQAWAPRFASGWNPPGWSLSCEAFFYLLFPWIGLVVWRVPKRALLVSLAAVWGIGMAAVWIFVKNSPGLPFIYGGHLPVQAELLLETASAEFIKSLPIFHLCEFISGVILGRVFLLQKTETETENRIFPTLVSFSFVALIGVLCASDQIPYFLLHDGLLLPLFAMIIYGLARSPGIWDKILSQPVLLLLGESSYALYILHAPIKAWFVLIDKHVVLSRWVSLPVQGLLYFTLTLTLSIVAYKKIEVPWRKRIQAFTWNRRTFIQVSPDTRVAAKN